MNLINGMFLSNLKIYNTLKLNYMHIFLFFLIFIFSFKVLGLDFNDTTLKLDYLRFIEGNMNSKKYKIPMSDPNKTKTVVENKNYLILFNPSEFSFEMMKNQASDICGNLNERKKNDIKFMTTIGVYTAFFSC